MILSKLGEGDLSNAAFQRVSELAAEREIVFSISEDFDELLYVNECNRDNWDPLMPQFHPEYFDAHRLSAFWIKGVNRSGKIVAARSNRRFDLPENRTLHDALIDLSFFYDNPKQASPGERAESIGVIPHKISGSFAYGGTLWIHPEARGLKLASLMWPIGRAVTYDRWDVPFLFSLVEDASKMRSVMKFEDMEAGIRWSGSYVGPEFDFTLVWWTRDRIAKDIHRFLRESLPTDR